MLYRTFVLALVASTATLDNAAGNPPAPVPIQETKTNPFSTASFVFRFPDLASPVIVSVQMRPDITGKPRQISDMTISYQDASVRVDEDVFGNVMTPNLTRLSVGVTKVIGDGALVISVFILDEAGDCATRRVPSCGVIELDWPLNGKVQSIDYRRWD